MALTVRVRLFAIQRELVGQRELTVDLSDGATIEDAWAAVVARHPVLAPGRPSMRFAHNGAYADPGRHSPTTMRSRSSRRSPVGPLCASSSSARRRSMRRSWPS